MTDKTLADGRRAVDADLASTDRILVDELITALNPDVERAAVERACVSWAAATDWQPVADAEISAEERALVLGAFLDAA